MSSPRPGKSGRRLTWLMAPLLGCCGLFGQAYGDDLSTREWNVTADRIVRYEEPNSVIARGNVVLTRTEPILAPPQASQAAQSWTQTGVRGGGEPAVPAETAYQTTLTVKADWVVYDVDHQAIKAKGHVRIITPEHQIDAEEGFLSLVDETGNFSDATVRASDNTLHLEGRAIEKTGEDTFRIVDGWVITCKLDQGETPPWSLASSDTYIHRSRYATLKHTRFNIRNVPVFYLPYLIVSINNNRQTGFLFPEISSSTNNGLGVNIPFFVDLSDSADITLYPEYLTNRGFKPGAEFRYLLSDSDKGMFTVNYLDDRLSDPANTDYFNDTDFTHDNTERYWLRGKADHDFGKWQTRLDLDVVSDQDYLNEFASGMTGFDTSQSRYTGTFGRGFQNQSDALRQNSLKGLRTWDGMALQTDLLAINDANTDASDTDTPLWQLPQIDYSGVVPIKGTSFYLDWNTNYVNYWREDGIGGQRLDLNPSLATPLYLSPYLESRAAATVHDTLYLVKPYGKAEWDNDDVQNRLYPELLIETATTLERDYLAGAGGKAVTHQVRPYLQYSYIPDVDQDELPQFDDLDLVEDQNQITYGVDNYLSALVQHNGLAETINDYVEWNLEQSFDLRSEGADRPFSDIFSKLKWRPLPGTAFAYKLSYDVYDEQFNRHIFEGLYSNSRGDYVSIDYSFNQEVDSEQINGLVVTHLVGGWLTGGSIERSLSADETSEARGFVAYQAACWSVRFETRYTPADTSFLVLFNLANLGVPLGLTL